MRRPPFLFVTLFVAVAFVNGLAGADDTQPAKPLLKVGAILPLTGEIAWFGEACTEGIKLALEDGSSKVMTVSYEDDRSVDKIATVTATQKLLNSGGDALLLAAAGNGAAVSSIVDKHQIPSLILMDSNNALLELSHYVFGFGFSNEAVGYDMAEFSIGKLDAKRVAVVSAHDEWSDILADAFSERLRERGGTIVIQEKVKLDDSDFRALVAKIRVAKVEAIYFPLYKGSLISLIRQIREGGLDVQLLTAEGLSAAEIGILGRHAEGVYLTTVRFEDDSLQKAYELFFKKSLQDTNLGHVAICYDAVKFLEAANIQRISDTGTLFTGIGSTRYQGKLGETNFTERRISNRRQSIVQVRNGVFQPAKSVAWRE